MELTTRYGLEFNPFIKNSKEILFEGREYKESLFRLDYLAKTKGFVVAARVPRKHANPPPSMPKFHKVLSNPLLRWFSWRGP